MDFYQVLDQVLDLLRRRGQMSYRALQRHFHLDEAFLEDLKEELLYAHPVVEEESRGLVWTGDPLPAPEAEAQHESARRLDAVLPEVIGLLQRQGRVTYRTLKQIFGLDETLLEDVRQELVFTQVARDEQSTGMVWTGAAPPVIHPAVAVPRQHATPDTAVALSAAAPTVPSDLTPSETSHDTPVVAAEPTRSAPEAERRQVTVMFCDLVDSTRLSQQLDPEDYRTVVRAYQEAAATVIQPLDGYIAQYLGDGLMVYFGWPQAYEDAAHRAVYAGLAIVNALGPVNDTHLEPRYGVRVAVRIGLHTGMAVIGEMGGGDRHEHLAMGDTPNIASRLQELAAPDTVAISAMTARLLHDAFALEDRGAHRLKGVADAMQVFRVLGALEADSEVEEATAPGVPLLVGRDEEIGLLRRRWEQSKDGLGQVMLIRGEAGIGKSALVETLRRQVRRQGYTRVAMRCSPYHRTSALYPVIMHVQRMLQFDRDDTPEAKLDKLQRVMQTYSLPLAEVVPLLAALLSVPLLERYPAPNLAPPQQKQQTLDTLVAWLAEEAERQPVLAVWEDLHWADPTTLEILGLFIDQSPTVPMLHVLTFRPEFVPPWPTHSHMTPLTLNRLERSQVEALIAHLAGGKTLPGEVVQHIIAKTDGVPLFVEELTKMLLESDLLHEEASQYALTGSLSAITIPATLRDSLMARLDRLPTVREVAQLGAVLGREFAYEVLEALTIVEEPALQKGLEQLVEAELLYQRGRPPRATYIFKHALIQDVAYTSLLKRTRQQYHHQVAQLLETRFPEIVESQPELLAHHYTEADQSEPALRFWQQAGEHAQQRSANAEAISHLSQGLAVLTALPDTPERNWHELALLIALGNALIAAKGYAAPEVEHTYSRARALCLQMGETSQLLPTLYGLFAYHFIGGKYRTALELGEEFFQLAQRQDDPALLVAHRALGWPLIALGELEAAREHFEQIATLYDPQQHRALAFQYGHDPGVAGLSGRTWALWFLGYPDQALRRDQEAMALAQEVSHPLSLAYALNHTAMLHQLCRDVTVVQERAEAGITLSTELDLPLWRAWGLILRGWALTERGTFEAGIVQIRQGLDAAQATGAKWFLPYLLSLLAEAYGKAGQANEGLHVLREALTVAHQHENLSHEAEIHRLTGELLLHAERGVRSPETTPEACFQQALDIARRQQAKSLELRAAMSLSRLWRQEGKRDDARALLAPIYDWFTEGFDTADLQEAKTLLDELGTGHERRDY
jgi:predicted ATPase/class 3 adenylate cyclase